MRALLVDDENPARKQMRALLQAHPGISIVGEAESVAEAAGLAAKESPDVIFLDVQMPEASGFELLPLLNPLPEIVFVTAHDRFAVRAFEANALDYLLKPVHPKRLAATVERLLNRLANRLKRRPPDPRAEAGPVEKLQPRDLTMLRDGGNMRIVQVRQIAWIEAEGIYTRLQLERNAHMRMLRSIGEWEALLPGELFARLDRSLIVNLGWVEKITVQDRNLTHIVFHGVDAPLSIGRTASAKLRNVLRTLLPQNT